MTTLTKVQTNKILKSAIDAHLNKGVSLNDTAQVLADNKIDMGIIMSLNVHIQEVGQAQGWILTPEKIKAKVLDLVKNTPITHFLDVLKLAKMLDVPQLSDQDKLTAIVDYSGVEKSKVKEPAKFKQFHNSGHFGKIAEWVLKNPEFTASEIHSSGLIDAPNKDAYYDEMLAYREFFYGLYETVHSGDSK